MDITIEVDVVEDECTFAEILGWIEEHDCSIVGAKLNGAASGNSCIQIKGTKENLVALVEDDFYNGERSWWDELA